MLSLLLSLTQAPVADAAPKPIESLPPLVQGAQAISPDHTRIAISTRDEGVWVVDIATKLVAFRVAPTTSGVEYVTWSNDSTKLGLLHRNADIDIVDARSGAVTATMHSTSKNPIEWDKREIHFAAGGTVIVAALGGPPTDILRCEDGARIAQIIHHSGFFATAMALSPDGTRLALGTHEGDVSVWDTATGRKIAGDVSVPLGHSRRIRSMDFDSRGEQVAIGSGNCRVLVWCPTSKAAPRSISICGYDLSEDLLVDQVLFSRDDSRLLVTSGPFTGVSVMDVSTGASVADLGYERNGGRPLQAWFTRSGEQTVTSADLRILPLDSSSLGARSQPLGDVQNWWQSDGDYAWAVVDHHLVVRKIPDAEPVLRVKVREK